MSVFQQLNQIDVSDITEQRPGPNKNYTYLSWSDAVEKLLTNYPAAEWEFLEPTVYKDQTMMVWCAMTIEGIKRTAFLYVMDNRNAAIANPNAQQINKAMQRCLAKAIGLHGLGLYIYKGEDLPSPPSPYQEACDYVAGDAVAFHEWNKKLTDEARDAAFDGAPRGEKTRFKDDWRKKLKEAEDLIASYQRQMTKFIDSDDAYGIAQLGDEMPLYVKEVLMGRFTPDQIHKLTELKKQTG
ncbi:MAG: hypothetical protein Unbinned2819contig1003_15 [Prokaryotic dsDNA virus sp.]|nr:MAG: hypothetical protein Unbinned2819contig1003_15 [Prokaryotic dsDNA virus sp.]|tara:strand:- start:8266 stop:8985 length:720 start_codon:yes stop_codon:yes gene_type:complete